VTEPALEARDVSMRRCGRSLVQRVSLTADRGELLALCGPEGSGTRTLLHLLSGHLVADAGRILVDGRERSPRRAPSWPDPRRLAFGSDEAWALLTAPGDASVLLLERPLAGLEGTDADALLACARQRAAGCAVVVTADEPAPLAAHVTTLALLVAGRLVSWGAPPVALAPALHVLTTDRQRAAVVQAGSIMTSST
jgi:ABC-type hemin transport system ATPase subunit